MANYLNVFETQAAYDAAKYVLDYPNVSWCKDNNLNYAETKPEKLYVEIGGVKWATKNVGAENPWEYGLYFQWGDAQGYTASQVGSGEGLKAFRWTDYKYSKNGGQYDTDMTKYNKTDNKTVLDASDDAVVANLGGSWRMPTTEEFQALASLTTSVWTTLNGVSGRQLTVNSGVDSGKTLFFPAQGFCNNGSVQAVGDYGFYWSSSLYTTSVNKGYCLSFGSKSVNWMLTMSRERGFAIRGVLGEN